MAAQGELPGCCRENTCREQGCWLKLDSSSHLLQLGCIESAASIEKGRIAHLPVPVMVGWKRAVWRILRVSVSKGAYLECQSSDKGMVSAQFYIWLAQVPETSALPMEPTARQVSL